MEEETILIDWYDLLDGGFAAATTLVSFGVVIGKTTPMQLLGLAFIEVPLWVLVNHIGYGIIGAIDVGKYFQKIFKQSLRKGSPIHKKGAF